MEAKGKYNLAIASDTTTVVDVGGARYVEIYAAAASDEIYFDFSGKAITDADMKTQLEGKMDTDPDKCTAGVIRAEQKKKLWLGNHPSFNKLALTCLDSGAESGNVDLLWY